MFGNRRRLDELSQLVAELRATIDELEGRLRKLAESADALRSERLRESHDLRTASAKADVALRRADEIAADRPGQIEGLAARIDRLERATARELEELSAQVRHVASGHPRAELIGAGLDVGPHNPPAVAGEPLAVHGWALVDPDGVATMEVTLDGRTAEWLQLALPRTDVEEAFAHANAPMSGFSAAFHVPADAAGKLLVDAVAVGLDRSRFRIGSAALPVVARDEEDVPAPASLERTERSVASDSLRLAVFAHSLDYGGAELRMLDLLNALAAEPGFEAFVVSGRDGPLREELEGRGFDVHLTAGWGVGSAKAYESWQQEVGELVREWNPTVAMAVTLAAFFGIDLAGRLGIPSVWSIHETTPLPFFLAFGFPFEDRVHRYAVSRAEEAFRSADALVFEAEASRRLHSVHGGDDRATVVPPGIELATIADYRAGMDRARARAELGVDASSTILLAVGVLQPRKAQALLVQAFREVAERHDDPLLVLVGDREGAYAYGLREVVRRSELEARVEIVPARRDVLPWFAAADLFVSASQDETLPGVILEAGAFELPVLSTAVGGIPELIEDGVNGLLCPPNDLTALVDGLERLLALTDEQRRVMGAELAAGVRLRHDAGDRTRTLGELIRSLAAARRDAAAEPVSSAPPAS